MNALKHGLRASKNRLLPGEDEDEYAAFYEAIWEYEAPDDAIEEVLVDQEITYLWRLRRVPEIEAGILTHYLLRLDADELKRKVPRAADVLGEQIERGMLENLAPESLEDRAAARAAVSAAEATSREGVAKLGLAFVRAAREGDALSKLALNEGRTVRLLMRTVEMLDQHRAARREPETAAAAGDGGDTDDPS